ncbi:FAD-dependent oxidoreductase [Paeniglutamicibacter terrestris]|uniref:FAD-binding protein n=1 Tax=Paeniglutamicibacter terrestris TaxID=2723403 RepID=A0ABX1G200_9MICC|nr:FAD-dependent oxidoreductase [Paeniglutamicibacter terrestris]NKG19786.1 FAD-binding protein [Paeniglutamicibacter terrestris]
MAEHIDADVLVIGAGPTGLSTANLLADQGLRVALIEKHWGSGDEPRAISATDETLRVMHQIGILDALAPEMLMGTGARYYGRGGKIIAEVRPGSPRLGHPGKSQFDQPVMEGLLFEAAAQRENIELHFNTEATSIVQHKTGVIVNAVRRGDRSRGVSGVIAGNTKSDHTPAADAQRTELTINAAWVIACDGGRSFTRRELGIGLSGSTQVEKWIVVDLLDVPGTPEPFASFHCNGTRPTVVVPGVKGRRRYEFMLFEGEDEQEMISAASITKLVSPYQDISTVTVRRATVYTAHQRIAEKYRVGRVLLAGDAAHLMPPFAGQGLNAGIRDAAAAAWRVDAHIAGEGTDALIDDYAAERRPHAEDMVKLSKRIGWVVMNTNPVITRVRDAIVLATRALPPLNAWLTQMRFLKQPHYTTGTVAPIPSAVPAAAANLVGRSLPQPVIQTKTGARALDELLSKNWTLLEVTSGNRLVFEDLEGKRTTTTDIEGVFATAVGMVLLVRPDRYVGGIAPIAERAAMLASMGAKVPLLTRAPVRSEQ